MNEEINKAIQILKEGGLILYPTDTIWGIGCDAQNSDAVEKVYRLKQLYDNKALICLVADDRMLQKYIKKMPDAAHDILNISDHPITIIYDDAQNLAKNLISEDGSIAIRIPDNDFCFKLLRKFNGAIVSTSANISNMPAPNSFKEISSEVLKGVDYIVNLHEQKNCSKPSSIIKLSNDGIVKIIRK